MKQRVWPRAIGRLAAADAYVAALVAQHALTVYDHYASDRAWTTFFDTLAASRARLLTRCEPASGAFDGSDDAADLLSLAFCNGWEKPAEYGGHRITVTPTASRCHPTRSPGGWCRSACRRGVSSGASIVMLPICVRWSPPQQRNGSKALHAGWL